MSLPFLYHIYWLADRDILVVRSHYGLREDLKICEVQSDGQFHLLGTIPKCDAPLDMFVKLAGNECDLRVSGVDYYGRPINENYVLQRDLAYSVYTRDTESFGIQRVGGVFEAVDGEPLKRSKDWCIRALSQRVSPGLIHIGPAEIPGDTPVNFASERRVIMDFVEEIRPGKKKWFLKVKAVGAPPANVAVYHYHPQVARMLLPLRYGGRTCFPLESTNLVQGETATWQFQLDLSGCDDMSVLVPDSRPCKSEIHVDGKPEPAAAALRLSALPQTRTFMPVSESSKAWQCVQNWLEEAGLLRESIESPEPEAQDSEEAMLEPLREILENSTEDELQYLGNFRAFLKYAGTFPECFRFSLVEAVKRLGYSPEAEGLYATEHLQRFLDFWANPKTDPAILSVLSLWPLWVPESSPPLAAIMTAFRGKVPDFFPFTLSKWLEKELGFRGIAISAHLQEKMTNGDCFTLARALHYLFGGISPGAMAVAILLDVELPGSLEEMKQVESALRMRPDFNQLLQVKPAADVSIPVAPARLPAEAIPVAAPASSPGLVQTNSMQPAPAPTTSEISPEVRGYLGSMCREFEGRYSPAGTGLIDIGRRRIQLGVRLREVGGGTASARQLFTELDQLLSDTRRTLENGPAADPAVLIERWKTIAAKKDALDSLQLQAVNDFREMCAERQRQLLDSAGTTATPLDFPPDPGDWKLDDLVRINSIIAGNS